MAEKARLRRVRLNLARSKEFPEGSREYGYDFVAPLDDDGHLDGALWKQARERCTVRRFWKGEPDDHGRLVHRAGGASGATWTFDYDPAGAEDDEPGYKLASHRIVPGEYISIRDDGGVLHAFRIIAVGDV